MILRTTIQLLVGLAITLSIGHAAEETKVYKSADEKGQPVFSDRAAENSEEIEIKEPQTFPSKVFTEEFDGFNYDGVQSEADREAAKPFTYGPLLISSPVHEQTIRDNTGNLTVEMIVPAEILPQHQVQLVMDDKVMGVYTGEPINLVNVDRGTHQLRLEIVDRDNGKIQKYSPTVSFNLLRHSVLH